jgi:hypothetical protein
MMVAKSETKVAEMVRVFTEVAEANGWTVTVENHHGMIALSARRSRPCGFGLNEHQNVGATLGPRGKFIGADYNATSLVDIHRKLETWSLTLTTLTATR